MALRYEGGSYWNGEDGPLSDADVAAIRDRMIDAWEDRLAGIAISLLGIDADLLTATEFPKRAVRRFSDTFRKSVADSITNSYVFAAGGVGGMTQSGWTELAQLINKQDRFAAGFVEAIRSGELSERQIVARARQYAGSGTEAFERGKAMLRRFSPPEVPGELCQGRTRCRCYWEIATKQATIEARWRAKNDASTCEHCAANAVRWSPLIQPIDLKDLERPDPDVKRLGMGDLDVNSFAHDFGRDDSTARHYLEPDGKGGVRFTADRQALHDDVIRRFTEGVPKSEKPTVYMLGGGGGAGKTTMIKSGKIAVPSTDDREAVLVNADEMKDQIPEYDLMLDERFRDSRAAAYSHEESSYLSKRLKAAAVENGQDILYDGVGKDFARTKDQADDEGYEVHGYYAYLPDPEVAVERARIRGEKTGRFVPPDVIRGAHQAVSATFPDAAATLDSMVLYETSTRDPVLVARREEGGELEIIDEERYKQFRSIGGK